MLKINTNYLLVSSISLIFFIFPMAKAVGGLGTIFLLVFGFFIFIKDFSKNKIEPKFFLVGSPFFILFLLALLGMFHGSAEWGDRFDFIVKSLRYPAIFFGAYFLYRFGLKNIAIYSFSLSMVATLCMVYASVFIKLPWAPQVPQMWGGDHTMWGDYITQNIMMSFFAVWMFHQSLENHLKSVKYVCAVLFVCAAIAVVALSYGRTGYVMLFAAFLSYCFCRFSNWQIRVVACVVAGVSVLMLYFCVEAFKIRVDQAYLELINANGQNSLSSIGARLHMWSTAWGMGRDALWFGVGSGSYASEWCSKVNDAMWCAVGKHPHNNFLLIFASNGIFALLAYILVFVGAAFLIIKKYTTDYLLVVVFLVILLIDSFLNGPFWNIREANFFTLIAAVVLVTVFEGVMESGGDCKNL